MTMDVLRRKFEDSTVVVCAAEVGISVKIAGTIHDQTADRLSSVASAGEVVQVGIVPAAAVGESSEDTATVARTTQTPWVYPYGCRSCLSYLRKEPLGCRPERHRA